MNDKVGVRLTVPLVDLKAQFGTIEDDVRAAINRVLVDQQFILGPEVEALERNLAAYVGTAHGIGVSSGTDGLLMSLMALDMGPGDEVITTPYSFFASAGGIARVGAKPVFVDIDRETYNIDAALIEKAITPNTKAIMPVHLFGQCADMPAIMEIARRHGLPVIEDAAQAIGAEHEDGRGGATGTVGCLSFFPSKNLGGYGDGGMVVTSDAALADKLRTLRVHGASPKYHHAFVGGNFRLDAIQAAVLRAKLPHLDAWTDKRRNSARLYNEKFTARGLSGDRLAPPVARPGRHVYNQYVIRVRARDELMEHLRDQGIGCAVYYPAPLHLQKCFVHLGYEGGRFPHAEAAAKETLALPMYPELTEALIDRVVDSVVDHVKAT